MELNMPIEIRLTTIDNPFDPFEQFPDWYMFDVEKGYDTCSHLARFTRFDDEMSEIEKEQERRKGIDKVLEYDFCNIYKTVSRAI